MTFSFRIALMILIAMLLCGCATKRVLVPQPYPLPVRQYVAIPPELTKPCPIAEGPLREVIDVARARRAALEACNGQLSAIRALSDEAANTNEAAPVAGPPVPR